MDKKEEEGLSSSEMSSELISDFFEDGMSEKELIFITYIVHFIENIYKILKKEKMSTRDFYKYIQSEGSAEQQKLSHKIYKKLQNRENWVKRKENFIKLESLLFKYEISYNVWEEKATKSKRLNDIKYAETRKFKEFVLNLYNEYKIKITVKIFYQKEEAKIREYINKYAPKLKEKSQKDINFDLETYVQKIIYTRNQKDNKNILHLPLE